MAQWGLANCGGTTLAPGAAQRTHAVPPLLCRHLPPFMGDWGRSPQKAGAFLTLWNEVPEEIWPFSLNILAMPVMGDGDGLATMSCRLPSFRQLWLAMGRRPSPFLARFRQHLAISPAFRNTAMHRQDASAAMSQPSRTRDGPILSPFRSWVCSRSRQWRATTPCSRRGG